MGLDSNEGGGRPQGRKVKKGAPGHHEKIQFPNTISRQQKRGWGKSKLSHLGKEKGRKVQNRGGKAGQERKDQEYGLAIRWGRERSERETGNRRL